MNRQSLTAILWFSTVAVSLGIAQQAPTHVVLTSQQDRQRMMDLLKITLFPSGPGAYLASTYDEKTANPYPNLPDPLTFNNNSKVKTAAQWRKRRAEIVELFDREVYGRRPKNIPKVTWTVANTAENNSGSGPVITKQLVGPVDLMFGNGGAGPQGVPTTTPCVVPGGPAPRGAAPAPPAAAAGGAARGA